MFRSLLCPLVSSTSIIILFRRFLSSLIIVFSKCKESLQDGERLENMCWRLWHREHISHSAIAIASPPSCNNLASVALLEENEHDNSDDYTDVISDEEVEDR